MVTKKQALDDLIDRYVNDARGFAWDPQHEMCRYDPKVNGGCAIGRFIPIELYDPGMEGRGVNGDNDTLFSRYPEVRALFEDPNSRFWTDLQAAHDYVARAINRSFEDRIREQALDNFEVTLRHIAQTY